MQGSVPRGIQTLGIYLNYIRENYHQRMACAGHALAKNLTCVGHARAPRTPFHKDGLLDVVRYQIIAVSQIQLLNFCIKSSNCPSLLLIPAIKFSLEEATHFGEARIREIGQRLRRIADARQPCVEVVKPGRKRLFDVRPALRRAGGRGEKPRADNWASLLASHWLVSYFSMHVRVL